jgi:Xaa-Pro aminopeptidase
VTLAAMDVAGRLPRVRERMGEAGCLALLVTNLLNVRYLTGFTGSAGLLLVLSDDALLVTDGRYGEQAADQIAGSGASARVGVGVTVAAQRELLAAAAHSVETLGLEAATVTWAQQRTFAAEWFATAELVATEGLVEGERRRKDPGEVARLTEAARIADEALATTLPVLAQGVTEAAFAVELDFAMRRLGAQGPSFETIVAAGPNGSRPHHRPSARPIAEGEMVILDFGALVDGYHSDITRTVFVGEPRHPDARHMWDVVREAQAAGVAAIAPGVEARAVDDACRSRIAAAGWGDAFVHGTGHGVGLQIHEDPRVAATSTATLATGDVLTVEPGVYLPGLGGVRIEDTVVVTDDGGRAITLAPKELIVS